MTAEEFTRVAHNFYISKGLDVDLSRIALDSELTNYLFTNKDVKPSKIALVFICLNPPYWEFSAQVIQGAKKFLLPGHSVDYFLWSDIPTTGEEVEQTLVKLTEGQQFTKEQIDESRVGLNSLSQFIMQNATVFPTDSIEWPMPTLMRYHLFLQQEEKLREYDYIFYCDIDMQFVNVVGDEILGEGLTAAHHPMYEVRQSVKFPLEPNSDSTAYIKVPEHYFAGGFQGGKTDAFIEAMKVMRKNIDKDFTKNYMARWNDESHWNRYLFDNPPSVILSSSYVYPDSLINEYYEPVVWGQKFMPRLVTLTKKFTVSKEGGEAVQKMIQNV